MNKIKLIAVIALFIILFSSTAYAQQDVSLEEQVKNQIMQLDTFDLAKAMEDMPDQVQRLWDGKSLTQLLSQFAIGQDPLDNMQILSVFTDSVKNVLKQRVGFICTLIAVSVIGGIISQLHGSVGNIATFICSALGIIASIYVFTDTFSAIREAILQISALMEAAFPPLMVLLITSSPSSAGVFQPITAILSGTVTSLIKNVLLPMVLIMSVVAVISAFSQHISFGKLQKTLKSTTKWTIGITGTLFLGFASIRGITAKTFDGVSMRTARYALDKLVPYVGSLLSGSADAVLGCSILLKNALGVCCLLILIALLVTPLLQIFSAQLAMRLASAIAEPLGDKRISNVLDELADVLGYLFAIVAMQGLMFALMIGLIINAGAIY